MRLTKEDISNIDRYLIKKGIKYIDVRYELIDHLVSEYESMKNYPDLESFLRKRTAWCRQVSEKKAKSFHWVYQKALLKRILSFFKTPVFYGVLLIWVSLLFFIKETFGTSFLNWTVLYLFVAVIIVQLIEFVYWRFRTNSASKMLSAATLFNIYSLPNLFIYPIGFFENQLEISAGLGVTYFSIGILVNVAAFLEVSYKRKKALKQCDFLETYFA